MWSDCVRGAMQQRKGKRKRRQRDDEEEEQPRKRGKEEADEDDDIFGYGATDPARGEAWTEEQDLRVSWLRFGWWILVLDFEAHALAWLWAGLCGLLVADSTANVRASEWIEAELDARGGEVSESE